MTSPDSKQARILNGLLLDYAAEGDALRDAVCGLDAATWRTPTPAQGWDVAAQIAHLAWTDEAAQMAMRATHGDTSDWNRLFQRATADSQKLVNEAAHEGATASQSELLRRWDRSRSALSVALRSVDGPIPWFGPPMSAASMATARYMETWAHGLDIYQTLGIDPPLTDRIRHVCHLGVRTRDFAYTTHGLRTPDEDFHIQVSLPSGTLATWGPDSAAQRITGSAYDFARLVTQRIHRADTDLVADGRQAEFWLTIAQAFAGPPGTGREQANSKPSST